MQIINITDMEDCFDQEFIKVFYLDSVVSDSNLCMFEYLGTLKILRFSKALYKIKKDFFWEVKGVVGENKFKVIFMRENFENKYNLFVNTFNKLFS